MLYNTCLLVGRAYALAHDPPQTVTGALEELHDLAAGDRPALVLAEARLREWAGMASSSDQERQALRMLTAVLERMEAPRAGRVLAAAAS